MAEGPAWLDALPPGLLATLLPVGAVRVRRSRLAAHHLARQVRSKLIIADARWNYLPFAALGIPPCHVVFLFSSPSASVRRPGALAMTGRCLPRLFGSLDPGRSAPSLAFCSVHELAGSHGDVRRREDPRVGRASRSSTSYISLAWSGFGPHPAECGSSQPRVRRLPKGLHVKVPSRARWRAKHPRQSQQVYEMAFWIIRIHWRI